MRFTHTHTHTHTHRLTGKFLHLKNPFISTPVSVLIFLQILNGGDFLAHIYHFNWNIRVLKNLLLIYTNSTKII